MPLPLPPFDLDLLRTFVMIAECGSFTRAAERLGRTQSTISLQIKRLEAGIDRRVFERNGRGIGLSSDGEILLGYARRLLATASEARAALMEAEVGGVVRLGTPEDFATAHLPDVLWQFSRSHPHVALEVRCDFTVNLLASFSRGEFDLVLGKREPKGASEGTRVWKEALVWACSERLEIRSGEPIPLVLAPAPDIYRKRALEALDAQELNWRVVYTSPSLAGVQAAVSAALGITILPRGMLASGFRVLGLEQGMPLLADTEIALYRAQGLPRAADLLGDHIVRSLEGVSSDSSS